MTDRALDRATRLQLRKDALLAALPPVTEQLRGSFFERTIRCGKASCKCASGPGHRLAYVGVSLAGGRTEQITVPRQLVPLARQWVANYKRWCRALERVSEINRLLLRERLAAPLPAKAGRSAR
jgi:hypothetical protein